MRLGIEVEIALPWEPRAALIAEFERGKEGITRVRDAMSMVDSSSARASDQADELKVKSKIVDSVGFKEVDAAIKRVMCEWVATELRAHMDEIMHDASSEPRSPPPADDGTDTPTSMTLESGGRPTLLVNLASKAQSFLEDRKCQAKRTDLAMS
jgi:hypothetical protein